MSQKENNPNVEKERYFKRFTVNQVLQHLGIMITFSLLVITGMPIKYNDQWWAPIVIDILGGYEMRSLIHHAAGIGMVLIGLYHVIYYLVIDRGPKAVLPDADLKDLKDFWQLMKYYFGKAEFPKYARYSWKEKFDYWGALWGMVIMCVSGPVLLYPPFWNALPLSFVHIMHIIHSDEALLATLAIVIWHWWNVHYNPDLFPMSKVWVTGLIPERQMKAEHPLEYEEIMRQLEEGEVEK
ncbi:Cytochrome B [Candidatus Methanoperedenaceae archaeon GB50]|nr:Cytochrome B [Candidatus Methanoperedenaceae archaeon GB37]CAD7772719.1 Cytochrome B [Candidatus Methanoperedenaceae archaeon GB50]CAD7778784.1 MAG: hypothetical protein KBONHNOK_01190 [Candidatus Methanoperedenaceae archaeon GB50]